MFKVFRIEEFEKKMYKLLALHERERVTKLEAEIAKNPFTGKPLRFTFLREKRIDGKRMYFLIYEELSLALMVSISDKKTQQKTIDELKSLLPEFRKLAEKLQHLPDSSYSSSL